MAGQHNRGWQVFHGRCDGRSGTFSRGFGRSGFRARLVSGSHAEEKRPTANPLALMYESRLRARGEILFLVRCCLTPMSDRVFSWKTRVVAAAVAEASGAEMVLWLNLNFQACLFFSLHISWNYFKVKLNCLMSAVALKAKPASQRKEPRVKQNADF